MAVAIQPVPMSAGNVEEPPLPPPKPVFFDTSILASMSRMSFLDPDYSAPVEVTSSGAEGTRHPRPLGVSGIIFQEPSIIEFRLGSPTFGMDLPTRGIYGGDPASGSATFRNRPMSCLS